MILTMKIVLKFIILSAMLLVLPLLGLIFAGRDCTPYLEFPPVTRYVEHEPFSIWVFGGISLFVAAAILPFIYRSLTYPYRRTAQQKIRKPFPWWGYIGLVGGILSWILSWTRFAWFEPLQLHTFTPLWISYILVINALTYRRSSRCMLLHQPGYIMLLFTASTAFWWFFEYLNRFVQNWYYVEITRFSEGEYFLLASISFSTVLPAVLGTKQFLETFPFFDKAFESLYVIQFPRGKFCALSVLCIAGAGLACIGLFPNILYPLLWLSPLLILVSLQALAGEQHIFSPIVEGDWSSIATAALAGIMCGFFWEMWNYYSLAKWIYSVPYVHRFTIFEMPCLGYAGYIPFGLECAVAGRFLAQIHVMVFKKNKE